MSVVKMHIQRYHDHCIVMKFKCSKGPAETMQQSGEHPTEDKDLDLETRKYTLETTLDSELGTLVTGIPEYCKADK